MLVGALLFYEFIAKRIHPFPFRTRNLALSQSHFVRLAGADGTARALCWKNGFRPTIQLFPHAILEKQKTSYQIETSLKLSCIAPLFFIYS